LNKIVPSQFTTTLNELYTKCMDIFGKETEPISTNNFYKQKDDDER